VKRQQNAFKHTARQGKWGVARGKGNLNDDPDPTFFSMKKKYFLSRNDNLSNSFH